MSDEELITGFETDTLPPGTFRHRDHVRLTWLYIERYGRSEAQRRLLDGLQRLALRAGKPAKFDAGLTRQWIDRIERAAVALPAGSDFEDLISCSPELLDAHSGTVKA